MKRMAMVAAVVLCLSVGNAMAGGKVEPQWVMRAREIVEGTPDRPRRRMIVLPLVIGEEQIGEIGWGRGVIALQAMWKCSFTPERVVDMWRCGGVQAYFRYLQLLGSGRNVTQKKIDDLCMLLGTENYVTGNLSVGEETYTATLTFHGENGRQVKKHEGSRDRMHELPCLIAKDVVDYLGVSLSSAQKEYLARPPLNSTELFEQVADWVPPFYYFSERRIVFWRRLVKLCRTPWTETMYIQCRRGQNAARLAREWGDFAPKTKSVGLEYDRAHALVGWADYQKGSWHKAGEFLVDLIPRDPYNADLVRWLAEALGGTGRVELAEKVARRIYAICEPQYRADYHHALFLDDFAWDARGGGWAHTVTEEGWKLFRERLSRAKEEYERSREAEPRFWRANVQLISTGKAGGESYSYMRKAFMDAISVCPTDPTPYSQMKFHLLPRWGGSMAEALAFGRFCAETKLYRTAIPMELVEAHFDAASLRYRMSGKGDDPLTGELKPYFMDPAVRREVVEVLDKMVEANPHSFVVLGYRILFAHFYDEKELAAGLLKKLNIPLGDEVVVCNAAGPIDEDLYKEISEWTRTDWPAVHLAARDGEDEKLKQLLEQGAEVSSKTEEGYTPLHVAVRHNNPATVDLLVSRGADIDALMPDGYRPLIWAMDNGRTPMVEKLLEMGADTNAPCEDEDGFTPLTFAAKYGKIQYVRWLCEHGADLAQRTTEDKWTALHTACMWGREDVVVHLLEQGAELKAGDDDGATPLHRAAAERRPRLMNLLISRGASVMDRDHAGRTPLHYAAMYGEDEAVEWLLEHGAPIDDNKNRMHLTPLQHALTWRKPGTAGLLMERGASLDVENRRGQPLLLLAIAHGHTDFARQLLERGVDVNVAGPNGKTALHKAAEGWNAGLVRTLLKHGADPHAEDDEGKTPLAIVRETGRKYMIRAFEESLKARLDSGADQE